MSLSSLLGLNLSISTLPHYRREALRETNHRAGEGHDDMLTQTDCHFERPGEQKKESNEVDGEKYSIAGRKSP